MRPVLILMLIFLFSEASATSFKKGYYYNNQGKKIEGLIRFNRATFSVFGNKPNSIKFKLHENAKPLKLTVDDISSFVVEDDSFAIVNNIKINSIQGEYEKDFAKVLINGPLTLYLHMSASSDGQTSYLNDRFVISKDKKVFFGIWNFKTQREEIANFFADHPDIKDRILRKELDHDNIRLIVSEYNHASKE